jgi:two-component system chemotaxis response regulator CheB
MDGLTFLALLMESRPIPVVVMSSLTQRGSEFALEALRLGAVDVIGKPGASSSFGTVGPELILKAKAASRARPRPSRRAVAAADEPGALGGANPDISRFGPFDPRAVILLGASTGGVEALHEVLGSLPADMPGIAVVQHIPALFSKAFAERLNQNCAMEVREAADGEALTPGTVLVAPGNFHLLLHRSTNAYSVRVVDGPPVWHQKPSVDLLFKSAAETGAGAHCIAGVLTGMGRDGAEGLLRLREHGAATFAQDEKTSVVYGMPRAAFENGAAQTLLGLDRIAPYLIQNRQPCARAAAGAAQGQP